MELSMEPAANLTISGIARLAECPESYVRLMDSIGVVTPIRDSTNRRLFVAGDAERIRAHREAKRRRSAA